MQENKSITEEVHLEKETNLENQEQVIEQNEKVSSEAILPEETTLVEEEKEQLDEKQMKIEKLEKELSEVKDQLLRLAADFDNYKKRTLKEKADIITYANEDLIKGILPILDDFQRTMKVVHTSDNIQAIKEGLELVTKNLFHQLNKQGVEVIPALNEEFNSELHEAVGSIPTDDESKKNKIIDVVEEGYKFHGRVIRYSKVIIGS
jgi:molecular chaperone GrpE